MSGSGRQLKWLADRRRAAAAPRAFWESGEMRVVFFFIIQILSFCYYFAALPPS